MLEISHKSGCNKNREMDRHTDVYNILQKKHKMTISFMAVTQKTINTLLPT